ncbi:alcohol dehydrogenase catalytic domain-containing protein [Neorhizobium sp. NPDC001467]|uniref:alcohol dehydrogenase catalytic domain-containing protein n=1 Tax=Neorhizobium sp. NPDC001467 TaxID=3390595 RepID=UPI003D04487F
MKAVVQIDTGEPATALQLMEIGAVDTVLQPDSVAIDVLLTPVHYGDLVLIRSELNKPEHPPHIRRGSEAVGMVRSIGANVSGYSKVAVGDRVIAFPASGSWAETVVVPAAACIPVPSDIEDNVAAQLLINFVTARMAIRGLRKSVPQIDLSQGAVLVTGPNTVVGSLLLHLLREEGIEGIGLARTAASAARIKEVLGDVVVAAMDNPTWRSQVTDTCAGKKIVGVLDCVSGKILSELATLLADDAAIISYGALGGGTLDINTLEVVGHQFVIRGVVFTRWFSELSLEQQSEDIRSAFEVSRAFPSLFRTHKIFEFGDIQAAVAAVEAPGRNGFVFLRP